LTSYLQNRQQFFQAKEVQFDMMQIICGVPQGPPFGHVLF